MTFAQALLFRGNMTTYDVDENLTYLINKRYQKIENNIRKTAGGVDRTNIKLSNVTTHKIIVFINCCASSAWWKKVMVFKSAF